MGFCWSKYLPPSVVDINKLHCSNCQLYLSCGPIKLTAKGTVCGRCTVPHEGVQEFTFEAMLNDLWFPCRFKNFDCKIRLPFNVILEHEKTCPNVPFKCPIDECHWHGSQHQTWYHFVGKHFKNQGPLHITINLDKDTKGYIVDCSQSTAYLLRYTYSTAFHSLTYDLSYFSNTTTTATYNIKLKNNHNNDININLRELVCLRFNPEKISNCTIHLNEYLGALDYPKAILVCFQVHTSTVFSQAALDDSVNLNSLESLRCNECHNYLSIPIFDSAIGSLCLDCSKKASTSRPSQNAELQNQVANTMFPCRWKKCSFVGKGDCIRQHELNCRYFLYYCPVTGCRKALIYKELYLHLNILHGMTLFNNRTSYKFFYNGTFTREFVTVRNNEMVVIKHKSLDHVHNFSLKSAGDCSKVVAKIYLEHSHCNLKSKTYTINSTSAFVMDREKLPKCFRSNQKLKIVIEV